MKKLILFMIALTVLAGCSMTTLPTENSKKREVPTWYADHAETGKEGWIPGFRTEYMYATASDVSASMDMAERKAVLKAKAKLADKVIGELTDTTTVKYAESGNPANPTGVSEATDVIVNEIRRGGLKYYEIEEKMVLHNVDLNNYRAFVLVKITKEQLNQAYSSIK